MEVSTLAPLRIALEESSFQLLAHFVSLSSTQLVTITQDSFPDLLHLEVSDLIQS